MHFGWQSWMIWPSYKNSCVFNEPETCFSMNHRWFVFSSLPSWFASLMLWEALFCLQVTAHHQEKPRQALKWRPRRNTAYQLASSGLLSYLFHTAQAHLPRDGTAHSGQEPPASIKNYKKMPHEHGRGQSDRGSCFNWCSPFPGTSSWLTLSITSLERHYGRVYLKWWNRTTAGLWEPPSSF